MVDRKCHSHYSYYLLLVAPDAHEHDLNLVQYNIGPSAFPPKVVGGLVVVVEATCTQLFLFFYAMFTCKRVCHPPVWGEISKVWIFRTLHTVLGPRVIDVTFQTKGYRGYKSR
jgi:hypothetical protein